MTTLSTIAKAIALIFAALVLFAVIAAVSGAEFAASYDTRCPGLPLSGCFLTII